jgi:hypothetical protein
MKYRVGVNRVVHDMLATVLEVEADSPEEAEQKALDIAVERGSGGWKVYCDIVDPEPYEIEFVEEW